MSSSTNSGRKGNAPGSLASYDALPYESVPIAAAHPEVLAGLARLAGHAAPFGEHVRILELGAASGGNLLPLAYHHPGWQCVGVDLSRRQVEEGQKLIAALGLPNARLLHRDIAAGLEDLGEFDYIIAHGLWSWVAEPVRQAVLQVIGKQLAPEGLAYVSFNVSPGWAGRAQVREMLLHAAAGVHHPKARLARAREFIERMAPAFAALDTPEAQGCARELAFLAEASPSYLYHEYLEDINAPEPIARFIARAASFGLSYLCDAEPALDWGQGLPAAAREAVADFPWPERLQYLDFLFLTRFRRALLVRRPVSPQLPRPEALLDLAIYADLRPEGEVDLGSAAPQVFLTASGGRCQVHHPLTEVMVLLLRERYPDSVPVPALLARAETLVARHGEPGAEAGREEALAELLALAGWRFVEVVPEARNFSVAVPERPRLDPLARLQIERGDAPAGWRHTALSLDVAASRLALLCDGRRDVDALAQAMADALGLSIAEARHACGEFLAHLARHGLLAR